MCDKIERHSFKVFNQDFTVDKRFQLIKEIGHGAYGIVCSARFTEALEDTTVAIKKVTNIFSKTLLCKRSLRELKLLRHFRGHKNITCLYDMDIVFYPDGTFSGLYLYEELMECDMHQIIKSGQPLTDAHYQSFVYQILCGLKYIHSADVLHRDLKPGNLLVNADCQLKICDFGLARGYSENPVENNQFLTEYVATRWYRAPEIMLSYQGYTKAIDVWSTGCILAEFLGGKPIFKGKDYVNQLNRILQVLGTPPDETLSRIGSKNVQEYIHQLGFIPKVPFTDIFPQSNPEALDLLEKMLMFDPQERITVEEALEHPYLAIWHDPADEPVCSEKFEFSFESVNEMSELRQMVIREVQEFRQYVRQPLIEEQEWQQEQDQEQEIQRTKENNDALNVGGEMQEGDFTQQMLGSGSAHPQLQESFGIDSRDLPGHDTDFPPRPQENLLATPMEVKPGVSGQLENQGDYGDFLDLEKELEFGLDRKFI
ncbi:SLT2 (YHR030C) and KDX1 (YKL161C) [Zygosaccharomyces parabailii]|nr:SLT2 (YHR030C) and KDX1 (YKL161C) [Zygosaccharomyces parabailii]CDH10396.1 probable Mitogen-activated protein kinase SLT2/MPK1 [Zygosaccharomyces bailii ISA1307]